MLTDKKVKTFVSTSNVQGSKKFYNELLGFKLLSEDDYGVELEMNNTVLRVVTVAEPIQLQKFTILGWTVPDIHDTINFLKSKDITFEQYSFMEQDELGIWTAPDGTRVAWFKDPAGNLLSIDSKD
jgi:catechol 2,3-dioxygenase-like lactoylglutathione lyase family enzyme